MSEHASKILVIEDEPDLILALSYNLKRHGYEVATEQTGNAGFETALSFKPDLVLLDLMLPDTSGFEVCRQLKSNQITQHTPVVMLTARGEEVDRVRGFEVGADDYVIKPFSVKELLLRLKVILKRSQPHESSNTMIRFGQLVVNKESHQVWVNQEEKLLTILEFNLLCTLLERRGKTQSRAQLLSDVWGHSADLTTRTVDTHIKRLRNKIGIAGDYIQTIRGVGYRFLQATDQT